MSYFYDDFIIEKGMKFKIKWFTLPYRGGIYKKISLQDIHTKLCEITEKIDILLEHIKKEKSE